MTAASRGGVSRGLSLLFGGLLLAGIVGLVVFVVAPIPATTAHTEFYVLGPNGTAGNYSTATVDEPKEYIVGIGNREHERVTYELVVEHEGTVLEERSPTVEAGDTWEESISVTFESSGQKRVDLLLYTAGSNEPYRELYVNVNVTEGENAAG